MGIKVDLTNLSKELEPLKEEATALIPKEKNLIKLDDLENIELLDITNDPKKNEQLKSEAVKFINFTTKSVIWIGEHLTGVFELLSSDNPNQHTSYYNKYLSYININERTARRYRKRYSIYSKCNNENSKKLISILTDDDINFLDENSQILERIEKENLTKEEFRNLKASLQITQAEQQQIEVNGFEVPAFNINNIGEKITTIVDKFTTLKDSNLDQETLKTMQKYLDKIDEILNKIENEN